VADQIQCLATGSGVDGFGAEPKRGVLIREVGWSESVCAQRWFAADDRADHRGKLDGLIVDAREKSERDQPGNRAVGIRAGGGISAASEGRPARQRGEQVTLSIVDAVDECRDVVWCAAREWAGEVQCFPGQG